ncbi:MAG: FliI/YscN family ATPase [Planctomycetota bacterium]|nr:FliI/YscN family ATPase [Planctomycetota bacterium]
MSALAHAMQALRRVEPIRLTGTVAALRGLTLTVDDLPLTVGSLVRVRTFAAGRVAELPGEVVGFEGRRAVVMMLGPTAGIRPGDRVISQQTSPTVGIGRRLLGRVINGLGQPIDGAPLPPALAAAPISPEPLQALRRARIKAILPTGVRAMDLMTTVGRGQRMGIFAGPGVGKSTLLGMIARRAAADVNVIALIGERGREVREFIEESLGPEGLARSIVVVSTSDESALMRVRAAQVACAAAEHFRDQGLDVMLMIDSITRFAHAQRQIGLAVGEPPATKGYTPSVFAALPAILERAGAVEAAPESPAGSITGFYTILVEGDDMTEPISDAARGILDGHVVLSRALAHRAHFPAIDVLDSISRVASQICDPDHLAARSAVVRLMAAYREVEDLIQIGAYAQGQNPLTDAAIALKPRIDALLQQKTGDAEAFLASRSRLLEVARDAQRLMASPAGRRN